MNIKNSSVSIVLPAKNEAQNLPNLLRRLKKEIPAAEILVIDDGSTDKTKELAEQADAKVISHPYSQGNGASIKTGARNAKGDIIVFMDADGQHLASDAVKFLESAKNQPESLVLGQPYFDESAPKSRVYGRKITQFFVWLETVSFEIKDTLCGFRVYPLSAFHAIAQQVQLRERMDFDPEIAVRMYWERVPVINIETPVRYDEEGLSHFHFFRDNVLMISLHVSLLLEALQRSPQLIWNAIKRNIRQ